MGEIKSDGKRLKSSCEEKIFKKLDPEIAKEFKKSINFLYVLAII